MNVDSQQQPSAEPVRPRRLRYPAMVELIILAGLVLLLMIGLWMIRSLVSERAHRAQSVRSEIASSWAQSQTIGGPVLIVPFRIRYMDSAGRPQFTKDRARVLPERLRISGQLVPERRHRGIFETVVYRGDLNVEGVFQLPDLSAWDIPEEDVLWSEAVITIGISDLRGIRGNPILEWQGRETQFSGGSADTRLWATGLAAPAGLSREAAAQGKGSPFSLSLHLNGSEQISFLPVGRETVVELSSSWPDPSFAGAFLPETRRVTASGFTARWSVSALARSYPQLWRDSGVDAAAAEIHPSAFGVGLFSPVGHYQKTDRAMKYGALFIILTFLTFFLYELLSPVTLHPVQYFLVGGALCLFYLLLLSISEHAPFSTAYTIGSCATIALIASYSAALLRSWLRVVGLAAVLSLLYGYLYVLLQLEDWALLMGSIGLFLTLALVMYATRRVDWGSAHVGGTRAAEA